MGDALSQGMRGNVIVVQSSGYKHKMRGRSCPADAGASPRPPRDSTDRMRLGDAPSGIIGLDPHSFTNILEDPLDHRSDATGGAGWTKPGSSSTTWPGRWA